MSYMMACEVFLILEEIKEWDRYMKMETLVDLSDWNCQFGLCLSEDIKNLQRFSTACSYQGNSGIC